MFRRSIFLLSALAICQFTSAEEAEPTKAPEEKPAKPEEKKPDPKEKEKDKKAESETSSVTHGVVKIGGAEVHYKATASMLPILLPDGKPSAQVFRISYVKEGTEAKDRPVTFCFNGGPGSSSVWLHLGAFGPKRVNLSADGLTPPKPPGNLVPNEFSLLDSTDLVFIDPVDTGFSHVEDPQKLGEFLGVTEDIRAVAEFMRLWLTFEEYRLT